MSHASNVHICVGSGAVGPFSKRTWALDLKALECFFQCMGNIFWLEYLRYPLKFHTKHLIHTVKYVYCINRLKFKTSVFNVSFFKRAPVGWVTEVLKCSWIGFPELHRQRNNIHVKLQGWSNQTRSSQSVELSSSTDRTRCRPCNLPLWLQVEVGQLWHQTSPRLHHIPVGLEGLGLHHRCVYHCWILRTAY